MGAPPPSFLCPPAHDLGASSAGLVYGGPDGATALMLTHDMPQVIERINGFFGWAAIGRIRILQRPLTPPRRKAPPRLRALTNAEEAELSEVLRPVEGTALGAALEKLGRAVLAKSR